MRRVEQLIQETVVDQRRKELLVYDSSIQRRVLGHVPAFVYYLRLTRNVIKMMRRRTLRAEHLVQESVVDERRKELLVDEHAQTARADAREPLPRRDHVLRAHHQRLHQQLGGRRQLVAEYLTPRIHTATSRESVVTTPSPCCAATRRTTV